MWIWSYFLFQWSFFKKIILKKCLTLLRITFANVHNGQLARIQTNPQATSVHVETNSVDDSHKPAHVGFEPFGSIGGAEFSDKV